MSKFSINYSPPPLTIFINRCMKTYRTYVFMADCKQRFSAHVYIAMTYSNNPANSYCMLLYLQT